MLKYADYVKNDIQIFVYTCAVKVNILSKSDKNFLLKNLISVIFFKTFRLLNLLILCYRIIKIFKMSFVKSRVASATFLFNYMFQMILLIII